MCCNLILNKVAGIRPFLQNTSGDRFCHLFLFFNEFQLHCSHKFDLIETSIYDKKNSIEPLCKPINIIKLRAVTYPRSLHSIQMELTLPITIPYEERNLIFYSHTLCDASNGFISKVFIKPFEAPQRSMKIKM